jgi:hypothetical protein
LKRKTIVILLRRLAALIVLLTGASFVERGFIAAIAGHSIQWKSGVVGVILLVLGVTVFQQASK